MNVQRPSLFQEERLPEEMQAVGKSRAKTKKQKKELEQKLAKGVKPQILEDWKPDKNYYSIGEVADLFHVATSHIRFWTNEFGLKVRTTKKGDRLYTPELIKELRTIYHLVKEKGYTLSGAKTKLKQDRNAAETIDLKQSLLKLRNQLVLMRNQLTIKK